MKKQKNTIEYINNEQSKNSPRNTNIKLICDVTGKESNSKLMTKENQMLYLEIHNIDDGNKMFKQQLFTIATLAYKMWEQMPEEEQLEDWMESKIAQCEQSVIAVVKTYLYDEVNDDIKGMDTLNYNDIIIGK